MNATVYILGILLQAVAGIVALLQVRRAPRQLPWLLIAVSSILIVGRRAATLDQFMRAGQELAAAEVMTLIISLLFFLGVVLMSRMFQDVISSGKKLKESEAALCDRDKEYRQIVETANEGIWAMDGDYRTTFVNQHMVDMLGYTYEEMIGGRVDAFMFKEDLGDHSGKMAVRQRGEGGVYERRFRRKDGGELWTIVSATSLKDAEGGFAGSFAMFTDITERKQAEDELRESEKRLARSNQILAGVLEHTHMMAVLLDPQFNFIWVNRAYACTCGHEHSFFLGKNHFDLYPHEENRAIFKRVVDTGEAFFVAARPFEFSDQPERGVTYWDWSLIPVKDAGNQVTGLVLTLSEVTERMRAEKAMAESEARFRALVESAPDAIFVQSAGRFAYVNAAACALFGASQPGELIGADFMERMAPEYRDTIRERIRFQRETGKPAPLMEQRYLRLDGSQVTVESTAVPIRYQGEDAHMVLPRDITARKLAEAFREIGREVLQILNDPGDLKDSMARTLATLKVRTGFDAVGIRLLEGEDFPFFVQQGFSEDFLLTENTLIKRTEDFGPCRGKERNVCPEGICGLVISGKTDPSNGLFTTGGSFWTNDSSTLPGILSHEGPRLSLRNKCIHPGYASIALVPIRSKDRIIGLIQLNDHRRGRFTLATVEILEGVASHMGAALMRKEAEQGQRDSDERNRRLIESSTDAIIVRSEGIITYANPAALKLFHASRAEELMGKPYLDLVHPDDRAGTIERVRKCTGENWVAPPREHRIVTLDGETVYVESTGVPVQHQGEAQIFGVFRDVTERKRADQEKEKLEGQLRQFQKLEAIGTLAGGIAHDFNNILSVIIGNSEMLAIRDEVPPSAKEGISQILTASQRAKQLVSQILTFSRQGEQQKLLISLKSVVQETVGFLRASLPATIKLQQYVKPDAGAIKADPTQMQQVLMNLCTNAAHAMEEGGGALKITLENIAVADEDARSTPGLEAGDYVKLTVSDTGHGIEPSVLNRVFDPYFTTKPPGKGTGLGLAVVHGIVKSHGGIIRVCSEVGKGTSFEIFFPRIDEVEKAYTRVVQPLPKGTEKILFVDDEPGLTDLGKRMLGFLGYQVEVRTSPIEALELFRANSERFDAVITDMTMPQLTGLNLAREVLAIKPGMPIMLCTGFSDQITESRVHAAGIRALLFKPLVMADLANELRKVLDEN